MLKRIGNFFLACDHWLKFHKEVKWLIQNTGNRKIRWFDERHRMPNNATLYRSSFYGEAYRVTYLWPTGWFLQRASCDGRPIHTRAVDDLGKLISTIGAADKLSTHSR